MEDYLTIGEKVGEETLVDSMRLWQAWNMTDLRMGILLLQIVNVGWYILFMSINQVTYSLSCWWRSQERQRRGTSDRVCLWRVMSVVDECQVKSRMESCDEE